MDERENTDLKFRRSGWEKTAGDSVLFQMTQAVFQLRLGEPRITVHLHHPPDQSMNFKLMIPVKEESHLFVS